MLDAPEHECQYEQTGGAYIINPPLYVFKCNICGKRAKAQSGPLPGKVFTEDELRAIGGKFE
jgi:hypothetical protein